MHGRAVDAVRQSYVLRLSCSYATQQMCLDAVRWQLSLCQHGRACLRLGLRVDAGALPRQLNEQRHARLRAALRSTSTARHRRTGWRQHSNASMGRGRTMRRWCNGASRVRTRAGCAHVNGYGAGTHADPPIASARWSARRTYDACLSTQAGTHAMRTAWQRCCPPSLACSLARSPVARRGRR